MPGVADTIRKTQLKQDQRARKDDMKELIRMVEEGRLHEADERQLETLKLTLELNQVLNRQAPAPQVDPEAIATAVAQAMEKVVKDLPAPQVVAGPGTLPADDPARPKMKHTSLADLAQTDEKVEIVDHGGLVTESKTDESAADKLAKLKKLRDGQG